MSTWNVSRFWPTEAFKPDSEKTIAHHISKIVPAIQNNIIAAQIEAKTIYCGLTAGRDTRVLLACTPPEVRAKTHYITFLYPEKTLGDRRDVHIGRKLSKLYGLDHKVLLVKPSSDEVKMRYFYRIGRSGGTGKSRDFYQAATEYLDMDSAWLTGFGGEVAIRYYHRSEDLDRRPTAESLLNRVHLPTKQPFVDSMNEWINGLPEGTNSELMVDLFYLEIRLACWACPHLYGAAPFKINLIPFSDRRVVQHCYLLPYEFRQKRTAQEAIIREADPRILELPFEQFTGFEGFIHRVKKSRFNPLSKLGA